MFYELIRLFRYISGPPQMKDHHLHQRVTNERYLTIYSGECVHLAGGDIEGKRPIALGVEHQIYATKLGDEVSGCGLSTLASK